MLLSPTIWISNEGFYKHWSFLISPFKASMTESRFDLPVMGKVETKGKDILLSVSANVRR